MPDVRCVIVGGQEKEPDLARLQTLTSRLGIENRVTFEGLLPPSAVSGALVRADVLALPNPASAISTHATSPLKLFEYMAAGKAIVASNLPAIREVLTDERTALLVTPGDPEALAAGLRRLAADPDLRGRLADAAPQPSRSTVGTGAPNGSRRSSPRYSLRDDDLRPTDCARPLPGVPRNHRSQQETADGLICQSCGRAYRAPAGEYLDLRPADQFAEQTKYLDEALHADARHERIAPPLLGSKIRNDMLRRFLRPAPAIASSISAAAAAARSLEPRPRAPSSASTSARSFREDARRGVPISCSAICAACRSPTARSPRPGRSTCSSTCRRRRCATCWREANRVLAPAARCSSTRTCARTAGRRRRALDQPAGARPRAPRPARPAPGTAAQVRSPQSARRSRRSANAWRASAGSASSASRTTRRSSARFVENILMRMAEHAWPTRSPPARGRRAGRRHRCASHRAARTSAKRADRAQPPRPTACSARCRSLMKLDVLLFGRMHVGPVLRAAAEDAAGSVATA